MRFQILSHAGLAVTGSGKTLVCDPWIIGSTYWRSWWNYPPVPREIVKTLRPDFIYLTHIHWDHYQGVSLRHLGKDTPVIVPRTPGVRMAKDLVDMGFTDVREIGHGETLELAPDFRITSYHFHVFLDSALVIETEGRTILNANDCKVMGLPLQQILSAHPKFDFVFRSHSSANSRLCYEIMDDPTAQVDDPHTYVRDFATFARAVGAEYAIPFASNSCYLHKDTFHFNDKATTPLMVKEYVEANRIEKPQVQIMVAGDSWSEEEGFQLSDHDWFTHRDEHLARYLEENQAKLDATYEREARTKVSLLLMERYFTKIFAAMPWFWRRLYRNDPVLYVLTAGDTKTVFEVDFWKRTVRELEDYDDAAYTLQVHTAAAIMRHCMRSDLFTHMAISKRVKYRVRSDKKRLMVLLNLFFNCYEYELLPMRQMATWRFVRAWIPRWREIPLWLRVFSELARGRGFDMTRYLPAPAPVETTG